VSSFAKEDLDSACYLAITITSLAIKTSSLGIQILVKIKWIIPKPYIENPT
jgi:hypothetical protein